MGKRSSHFCIVDEQRLVQREGKVSNTPSALKKVFGNRVRMRIVVEASTKSFWMADQFEALGHEPIVVDPGRTKAIGDI
jgi:transposase